MKKIKMMLKENSGFSLMELLVAIGILSVLMIPIFNSFLMSGKMTRNSRQLQNGTAVAQSVVELAKRSNDLDNLLVALGNMEGVSNLNKTSTETDTVWTCEMNVEGADTERFLLKLSLEPKTEYDYKNMDFADIYNKASVIYSELMLYDNSILTLIRNSDIPYTGVNAPRVYKWSSTNGINYSWNLITPSDADKALRRTYGNLFADEYSGTAIAGVSCPTKTGGGYDFTKIEDYFKKKNIDKQVDINISQSGNDFVVTIDMTYTIDNYEVVYRAEDPTVVPDPLNPDVSTMAFYKYVGNIEYKADQLVLTYDKENPIYLLYAKAVGEQKIGDTVVRSADPRYYKSVVFNVVYDASVNLGAVDGTYLMSKLYLVEQGTPIDISDLTGDEFRFNITNNSKDTALCVYTTEVLTKKDEYNDGGSYVTEFDTIKFVKPADAANIGGYSNRPSSGAGYHKDDYNVAYEKKDSITSLYKITAKVYYDKDHNGEYIEDELLYSVITED